MKCFHDIRFQISRLLAFNQSTGIQKTPAALPDSGSARRRRAFHPVSGI
jgi:hypothetical protein